MNKLLNNSLLRNTGIYTLTSIINSAIPFFLLPILTRYLTPEDYGIVSMFTLLVTFISPFIGLSINGAIARQYYNQEEVDIWVYVWNCIIILLISSGTIGLMFYIFGDLIAQISSFPIQMIWTIIIYSVGQFICVIVLTLLQVQKKALLYGIFNISMTLLNTLLSILFIVGIGYAWRGRIYGQLVSVLIFAVIAIGMLIKNSWVKLSFNKKYIYNALLFGIPLIPHALSGSIISMTDRIFITNMVGLEATGIYTVGYQVGSIINILAISFNNAYVPWLYERLKADNKKTKVKIIKFTYLYFVGIMIIATLLGLIAPIVLNLFLGKAFNESSVYVLWVAMGYAFNGMYLMVVNYIFYAQRTTLLAIVTIFTAAINIILNYFFIKAFGAIGAAQATAITFFIKFITVWILSAKVQKMPWDLSDNNNL